MDWTNLSLGRGLLISLFSLLVVFVVLIVISYLVDGTAFLSNRKKRRVNEKANPAPGPEATAEVLDPQRAAAITAVIAALAHSGSRLVIRKIEKPAASLTGWKATALQEQLRRRP